MMLVEVLIVVAIMSLVAGGVAVAAYKYYEYAKVQTATTNARAVRNGVKGWMMLFGGSECPTMPELIRRGGLDEDARRTDPWGMPWRIECSGGAVTVYSNGPDRERDTPDDIRVPPSEHS
jgi:hypothetical protein